MRRQQLFQQVKNIVHSFDPEARVFLYGSRARGDHKKLSDWDFFVLTSREFDYKQKDLLRDKLYETELEANTLIGSIIESRERFEQLKFMPLYQNILAEGIEI